MPTVQDMIEMTDLLKVYRIAVDEDRCTRVRNRNSTCTKCIDACIEDAISIAGNEIDLDPERCVNCGACIAVCPNDVMSALEPSASKVAEEVSATGDKSTGLVVFACSRRAAKHEVDDELFIELPCLAHAFDAELVAIAAHGLNDIVLVDGNCATCKYGKANTSIDETCSNVAALLEAVGADAIVTRTQEFPPELMRSGAHKRSIRGEDRRGLLSQTGNYVRQVATNVAKKTIDDKLGMGPEKKTLRQRLGASASGRMPTFEPDFNYRLIDSMSTLLEASAETPAEASTEASAETSLGSGEVCPDAPALAETAIDTRHFGSIVIDASKCSGCGMCVLFCPTAALTYAEFDEPEDPDLRYLEFQASMCTQCRLCEDVCLRACLHIDSVVELADIFDFEPALVEISKPKSKPSILDIKRGNMP